MEHLDAPNKMGRYAEISVATMLKNSGRQVQRPISLTAPFDMLVDGWRIDVKSALMNNHHGYPLWEFSIMDGKRKVEQCDFYILRIHDLPFYALPVHLLYKAPVRARKISVTIRSLIDGGAVRAMDFKNFMQGNYGPGLHSHTHEVPAHGHRATSAQFADG